jgi:hypothetical protein
MMMNRLTLAHFVVVAVAALSGGCGLKTTSLGDGVTAATLSQNKSGVAVFTAGMVNQGCQGGELSMVRQEATGPVPQKLVRTIYNKELNAVDIIQVELPVGEYHITSFSCTEIRHNRKVEIQIRELTDQVDARGRQISRPLASFSVNKGEFVNVGYLKFVVVGEATYVPEVTDLPAVSLAALRKTKPALVNAMQTRLMVAVRPVPKGAKAATPPPPQPAAKAPPKA